MSRLPRIKDRIRTALADGELSFFDLALKVFPVDSFPKAFNYQANGGPPGCYMPLSRALREMGEEVRDTHYGVGPGNRRVRLVRPHRSAAKGAANGS